MWPEAIADSLIGFTFFSIALSLLSSVWRRQEEVPLKRFFALLGLFTLACGLIHLMEVWALWQPAHGIPDWLKGMAALVSLYAAAQVLRILPRTLRLPSSAALAEANRALAREIQGREAAEGQVRQLSERLQNQVKELERLDLLKDDFLSTISHELRTPLTSIRLGVDMLQMSLRQFSLSEKQQQYLSLIRQECQREIDLVEDLLTLQELQTRTHCEVLQDLDLEERLANWIQALRARAVAAQQDLSLQILSPLPLLRLNAVSLERVFRELIVNACKHGDRPGQIQVQASLNPSPLSESGLSSLRIQVRNTGHIPLPELPHLFTAFYRVPKADPWKQGGTGLGLALVKKLVDSMQGKITVESEEGYVCFSVELSGVPAPQTRVDRAMDCSLSPC
ncbi:HAMP domain-containing histidine kinase [Synechococcus sp. R55.6]|uniref:sensor histidine kinase n=1 Tax=unclassified Synechococcus TaxID=2626047 RepID=UPI0039C3DEDB